MQFRQFSAFAATGRTIPFVGQWFALASSLVFVVLGIRHLLSPTDPEFSTMLFFNFVSILPFIIVLSTILFLVDFARKCRAGTWRDYQLSKNTVFNILFVLVVMLYPVVSILLYVSLSYLFLGVAYTCLNIIYLLPIIRSNVRSSQMQILSMIILFLSSIMLTWVALLGNDFFSYIPEAPLIEHMRPLPGLTNPLLVFINMSLLFILINCHTACRIIHGMLPKPPKRVRKH
jgi:hypothetical protein